MISTSIDILYLVLSLSVLWLTIFLCWLLYQAVRTLKNANDIIDLLRGAIQHTADAAEFIKRKMDAIAGTASSISGMIAEALGTFVASKIGSALDSRGKKRGRSSAKKETT